ncbi:MAG: anthranilate synthase component I family protein, partial [Bacteroidota bacterium]
MASAEFPIHQVLSFKAQALEWGAQQDQLCYLDSNAYASSDRYGRYEALIAIGCRAKIEQMASLGKGGAFDALQSFQQRQKDWLFGYLGYDLKNDIEQLQSTNTDRMAWPDLHFFVPEYVLEVFKDRVCIHSHEERPEQIFEAIQQIQLSSQETLLSPLHLEASLSQSAYENIIRALKTHIVEGDIYEINFCQAFFARECQMNPLAMYRQLNRLSPTPFSAFYRQGDRYLLCASPERFIQKRGRKLISQPIKGTIRRGETWVEDVQLKDQLLHSEKDRAENVMIVDLVRNDLARSCEPGSIKVEELFGIYGFEQVHQMISTVTGQMRSDCTGIEAIKHAFPMGSMTGAPKVMSMQLIEAYENTRRGLYSGALGYIRPDGDFDFNVVIRSMLYQAEQALLSFQVGGAIVYDSVPALEYEECLLKAKALIT